MTVMMIDAEDGAGVAIDLPPLRLTETGDEMGEAAAAAGIEVEIESDMTKEEEEGEIEAGTVIIEEIAHLHENAEEVVVEKIAAVVVALHHHHHHHHRVQLQREVDERMM